MRQINPKLTACVFPMLSLLVLFPALPGRAQGLNDTAYNQQFYVGTHNAFANSVEGYSPFLANQERGIRRQLEDGVRLIGLDVWQVKQKRFGLTNGFLYWNTREGKYKGSEYRADDDLFDFDGVEPDIVVGHGIDKSGYYLLSGQGIAYLDKNDSPFPWDWRIRDSKFRSLADVLRDIREFMDENAAANGPIVTLELESYVGDPYLLRRSFQQANLWDRIFYADRPNPGCFVVREGITAAMRVPWEVQKHGWPTTNQMVAWRRDLVVFTDRPADGMPSADDFAVASAGDPKCFDPALCIYTATGSQLLNTLDRGLFHLSRAKEQTYLFGVNLGDSNNAPAFYQFWFDNFLNKWDTGQWNPLCGRLPTSISVDYYNRGGTGGQPGPLWLEGRFNQEWQARDRAEASVARRDQRPPLVNGWYQAEVDIYINNHQESDPDRSLSQAVRISASPLPDTAGGMTAPPDVVPFRYETIPASQKIFTVTEDGTTVVAYHGISKYGKCGDIHFEIIRIDRTAPFSQLIDYKIAPGQHGVELQSYDAASGLDRTYYRVNNGAWQNSDQEITLVLPDGRHKVEYYGVDKVGNQESLQTAFINVGEFASDVVAPVTTLLPPFDGDRRFPFGGLSVTDSGTPVSGWESTAFLLNGHAVDTTQGQVEFVDAVRNSPWLKPGFNEVEFFSRDRAGNLEEKKSLTYFNGTDAAAPKTTLALEDYIGDAKKVRLEAADAGSPASGVFGTFYRLNNGTVTQYVDSFLGKPTLFPGRHVVEYWSQDNLGNAENRRSEVLFVGPVEFSGGARVTKGALRYERATNTWRQPVTITNTTGDVLGHPASVILHGLPAGVTLMNPTGQTTVILPSRRPYINLPYGLDPNESVTMTLIFSKTGNAVINYEPQVFAYPGAR